MYTLLLVDDEEDVIEVIERKVSWEQIGFHVVGHAGNGFKALEMMEDMQPDVVMTDIRMLYLYNHVLTAKMPIFPVFFTFLISHRPPYQAFRHCSRIRAQ